MELGTHIHVSLRMNSNTFGDPLTFLQVEMSICSILWFDEAPAKPVAFPLALAVLSAQPACQNKCWHCTFLPRI